VCYETGNKGPASQAGEGQKGRLGRFRTSKRNDKNRDLGGRSRWRFRDSGERRESEIRRHFRQGGRPFFGDNYGEPSLASLIAGSSTVGKRNRSLARMCLQFLELSRGGISIGRGKEVACGNRGVDCSKRIKKQPQAIPPGVLQTAHVIAD